MPLLKNILINSNFFINYKVQDFTVALIVKSWANLKQISFSTIIPIGPMSGFFLTFQLFKKPWFCIKANTLFEYSIWDSSRDIYLLKKKNLEESAEMKIVSKIVRKLC